MSFVTMLFLQTPKPFLPNCTVALKYYSKRTLYPCQQGRKSNKPIFIWTMASGRRTLCMKRVCMNHARAKVFMVFFAVVGKIWNKLLWSFYKHKRGSLIYDSSSSSWLWSNVVGFLVVSHHELFGPRCEYWNCRYEYSLKRKTLQRCV